MKKTRRLLLMLLALLLALTTAPAFADSPRNQGFRDGHRMERRDAGHHEGERQERERAEHGRWEHRDFRFAFPAPYVAPYCYTQAGYWTWDGWQYVWVPPQTVCD